MISYHVSKLKQNQVFVLIHSTQFKVFHFDHLFIFKRSLLRFVVDVRLSERNQKAWLIS